MSRIAVATASAELQQRLERATDGACRSLPLGPLPATPAAFFAQLDVPISPEVVVLDAGSDLGAALALASLFNQQCPSISLLLVTDLGLEVGLPAMRAGIRDVLHPTMDPSDLRAVLDRTGQTAHARALEPEVVNGVTLASSAPVGRVITVVSPKGGVGKTTVATNLAVGLAHSARHSTVLVDLDIQFGDVASALNLDPEYSLPDTLRGPASRDTMVLKTFLTLHETGLYVICGPKTPGAADSITGAEISHLLRVLASEFQYVVVDTTPGLSEHVLAAMDESDELVLVTSMDVPGVRSLRKEIDALTDLKMVPDHRYVVLNFTDVRSGLSVADVEATLGTSVNLTLPRSKATPTSVNQGVPLLQSGVRDPMTAGLRRLVARYNPAVSPSAKSNRAETRRLAAAHKQQLGPRPRRALSPFHRGKGAVA